jgi:type I restriction enzyme M protein
MQDIEKLETDLWDAADNLRANSKLTAGEYCMPVLGVIFLRHATNRYNTALREIDADQAAGKMPKRSPIKADFLRRRSLMLPKEARYDELLQLPKGSDLGTALVDAMNAIERDFEPLLNQLPKDYTKFENALLEDLLRVFDSETLRNASGDVFGRINEYFLMKFAMQGAQDNGEFFTPPSLVQTIVNIIEPDHGIVFDPACGSGGMFVQSSHFIEQRGESAARRLTFYGQEYKTSNLRLAKMNLAVHGLEGNIVEANTFYEDRHELHDKCDFVMANPPFNVDKVDAEKAKEDRRVPFGLPGVNKEKKVSNGNYLWISYFWSYLNKKGRAGFVMSSQASSAGNKETEVRRKIVETGDVDVMISIRPNFFYTRTVPCELWFFDKGKPANRRDQVLMIDARKIFRKVTRKIYDFSPEQLQNLSAIVWLYRGEREKFTDLLKKYRYQCHQERRVLDASLPDTNRAFERLGTAIKGCDTGLTPEFQSARKELENECAALSKQILDRDYAEDKKSLPDLAKSAKALIHRLREAKRLCQPLVDKGLQNKEVFPDCRKELRKSWDLTNQLWEKTIRAAESNIYFTRQIEWLEHRFPKSAFQPVAGLCKIVSRDDIKGSDWSLTPGRYVGVAPPEVDEDFDFEETIRDIHGELAELNKEAAKLGARIQQNFEELI